MIDLFKIDNYIIDTSNFQNLLHDKIVNDFENYFLDYVGAKYACTINSATNAIFLLFLNKNITVNVPSMIPPVVLNSLINSGNKINFLDNTDWIGDSYILHEFDDYKIIDSAQKVERDQFKNEANPKDMMFFSFYPTKPVSSSDGGIIVSDDYSKIKWLKEATMNGMSFSNNNWERIPIFPGYKMYMNSIQAYIAYESLKKLDKKKEIITKIVEYYNNKLGYNNKSKHLYRIEVNNNEKFINYMKKNGVTCGIHYKAQHNNSIYTNENHHCPNSEIISKKTVSLPLHTKLKTSDLNKIINLVKYYD